MTHKVITVAPSATLREVAEILKSRHIKRVPVVEDGRLVGIVSRANLVQALASSGAGAQTTPTPMDRDIRAQLCSELSRQRWAFPPTAANIIVDHGEVHLMGLYGTGWRAAPLPSWRGTSLARGSSMITWSILQPPPLLP